MIESMLIAGFLGLPAAMLTAMLLKRRCLARYFYKASLIFVATCVLAFGPGKSVSAFGGHKGQTVHMDTDAKDKAKTTKDKVKAASLIEQAPIVIDINRRYYKFYGKPSETVVGGGLERSQLTNNWNGGRDKLTEAGVEK
jgi:hypothetical protein